MPFPGEQAPSDNGSGRISPDTIQENSVDIWIRKQLRALAQPYVTLNLPSKETLEEIQLVYGRYVIELQSVSLAQALTDNLTEEEVRELSTSIKISTRQ